MTPDDPAEYGEADARAAGAIGGDLWSAPISARPADDMLAGQLPGPARHSPEEPVPDARSRPARHRRIQGNGPARHSPEEPVPDARRSRPARHRRISRRSMSLVVAVAVLIGLGFAAQRLDPSRGAASSSPGDISTQNPGPTASPSPTSTQGISAARVVVGGPPYCPMQADSAGLDCFFIG